MKDIRFQRERFLKGNSYYAKKGISAQPSQLRIEVPLVDGKGTYDFDIAKEIKRASEMTLKRNDLFVVRAIGMALKLNNAKKQGMERLYTAPPMLGSDDGFASQDGFSSQDIYALYNGYLSLKTGQTTNFSAFPTLNFLHIPETQRHIVGVKSDDTKVFSEIETAFSADKLFYELPEEIVLAGTQDHKIRLEFPCTSDADLSTDEGTGSVVLLFQGWLYEGATGQEYKDDPNNPYRLSI